VFHAAGAADPDRHRSSLVARPWSRSRRAPVRRN
jgi:hypothetical protein